MNHTIQLTAEQFEALQSGQPITIEPPKPAIIKWEPKPGRFTADISAVKSYESTSTKEYQLAGMEYQTKFQANSAAKAIRAYARQLAWVSEHYPDYNISEKSYETDLILATLPNNIAYHLINEIQKGIVSL